MFIFPDCQFVAGLVRTLEGHRVNGRRRRIPDGGASPDSGGEFSRASYQFNLLYKGVPLLTALLVTSCACSAHGDCEQVVEQVARCTIRRGIRRKSVRDRVSRWRRAGMRSRGQRNSYAANGRGSTIGRREGDIRSTPPAAGRYIDWCDVAAVSRYRRV